MSDSDAGTSTGSTPYESEDEMICYITGCTESASGHPDQKSDVRRINERSMHSRQMKTEVELSAETSDAAGDSILGTDTHRKTRIFSSEVTEPSATYPIVITPSSRRRKQSKRRTDESVPRDQSDMVSTGDLNRGASRGSSIGLYERKASAISNDSGLGTWRSSMENDHGIDTNEQLSFGVHAMGDQRPEI